LKTNKPKNKFAPFIATSFAVARLPGLSSLLEAPVLHRWSARNLPFCAGVIAWGRKPSAAFASEYASRHNLLLLRIEDGFLRSVGLGNQEPPLSIVVDDLGIYYDAASASRLEILINTPLTVPRQSRAQSLINAWKTARVSKYNYAREYARALPVPYILVADQTLGDASIQYGLADKTDFQRMLDTALQENPDCTIVLKTHPDVMLGRKQGHFNLSALADNPRIMLLGEDVHPVTLLEHAQAVYCVTSQIGFEGLLWGKPVHTFGMPFYAGWGLTHDHQPASERRMPVTLENLVHAALIDYPRYIDPETGMRCEPERLIAWMGLQRQMRERFPAIIDASGFSICKKPVVRRFFQGSSVLFDRNPAEIPEDATHVLWGRREIPDAGKAKIIRLEDGFIRSVGLGADLIQPLSWALDSRGIYYDANQPSDLEAILQNTVFDGALLKRAQRVRERLVAEGLTKYNVGATSWQRPDAGKSFADHEKIAPSMILVPGQVESDASIAFGAPNIARNLDLLKAVREANPQAYIIYKPHPDVVAGLRKKGLGEDDANRWCNEIVVDVSMGKILAQVDEVHTLTSLTGFEALLRGKKVVCYGLPFYAGWGLTEDVLRLERRSRNLTLDELVVGVLILYPTYISRTTGKFTTPERALDELLTWRENNPATLPWWRIAIRWFLKIEAMVKQYL